MWNSIKRFGNLLLGQTREQKEILLLRLKIKGLTNKQDAAFARLGKLFYPLLKSGSQISPDNRKADSIIKEIGGDEEEVNMMKVQLDKLKSESATGLGIMAGEMENVWEKTKSTLGTGMDKMMGQVKSTWKKTRSGDTKSKAKPHGKELKKPAELPEKGSAKKIKKETKKELGGKTDAKKGSANPRKKPR